jgi:hypothetical protein
MSDTKWRGKMSNIEMPKAVHDALVRILNEFGDCDLHPRLEYFMSESMGCKVEDIGEYQQRGRDLLRAFNLVEQWSELYGKEEMTPEEIAESIKDSDEHWKERYMVLAEGIE